MIGAAIGVSDHVDYRQAITEVLEQCEKSLAGAAPQAGVLFTSIMDADFVDLLAAIDARFPGIELIGCTTDGEIAADRGFLEDAIALLLITSEHLSFAAAVAEDLSSTGTATLSRAIEACRSKLPDDPKFGIILPDGLTVIDQPLDLIIRQASGNRFPIFGGTAGDHFLLKKTYQFCNGRVYSDAAPILLCSGRLNISTQVVTGTKPIGRYYQVDCVDKNVLYEIDGKRAADFYTDLLGSYAGIPQIAQFPLAVYESEADEFYLRDPFNIDKSTGTVTSIGTFPATCRVRLTSASREDILNSAREANLRLVTGNQGRIPDLVLLFSCTSRRHILGTQTNEEFSVLRKSNPMPFFGFYCYGEIGPFSLDGPNCFHNDTYIAVALSESD